MPHLGEVLLASGGQKLEVLLNILQDGPLSKKLPGPRCSQCPTPLRNPDPGEAGYGYQENAFHRMSELAE